MGIQCCDKFHQLLGRTHPFFGGPTTYLLEDFILYPHTMDMGPSELTNNIIQNGFAYNKRLKYLLLPFMEITHDCFSSYFVSSHI
jgi:hypothetical protein